MSKSAEIREQMKEGQDAFKLLAKRKAPLKGWIRSIREALGMSGRQLANGLGVKTSRISELEKAEVKGNVTLKTLRRAAETMDCEFIYALVPKTSLDSFLKKQASEVAYRKLKNVAHSMRLEEQSLSNKDENHQMSIVIEEWVKNPPRWLWDLE